jgi:hypothetical protein
LYAFEDSVKRTEACLQIKTVGWRLFVEECACVYGLREKSVCTYTTSGVPAGKTKELGDVLEVGRPSVLEHTSSGIAVAIKAGNGLGDRTLRRIVRS